MTKKRGPNQDLKLAKGIAALRSLGVSDIERWTQDGVAELLKVTRARVDLSVGVLKSARQERDAAKSLADAIDGMTPDRVDVLTQFAASRVESVR